jgi:hypothetical protein
MSRPVSLRVFLVFGAALVAVAVTRLSSGVQQKSVGEHGPLVDLEAVHEASRILLFRAFEDGFVERAEVSTNPVGLAGQWYPLSGPAPRPFTQPAGGMR